MRIAVLVLLALATAGAAFVAFHGKSVPVGALFLSSASLLIGAIVAFVHLRHAGLAVLTALAPLPGMIAAGAFAVQSGLSVSALLAVYGFSYLTGSCLGGDIWRRILDAAGPAAAAREALARIIVPAALGILVAAALIVGWLFRDARLLGLGGACELGAGALSALVFVPFASSVMWFREGFFVAANRARERREGLLRVATLVIEPRWGMSLSGIAIVFATLGWFGAEPVLLRSVLLAQPALWGASALLVFLVSIAAGRDWRNALAAVLTLAALTLLGLFLWARSTGHLSTPTFIELVIGAAAALLPILMLVVWSRTYRWSGDTLAVARLRAIEDLGLAPWFGVAGAGAAALPWVLLHGSVAMLSAMFLLAGAAGLLAMPALATALDSLMPRRRSVDELYGRG